MSEVKWIKLATNVFNNRKIRLIESMPDGDSIIVIWFKLLMLAGEINDDGNIYFTKELAYTDQMLSTVFDRPIATIQLSLKTFEKFGMIEIIDNIIHISNWEKYQNVEGLEKIREQTKKRVSRHREKLKIERQKDDVTLRNVTRNATVTQCNATDIEEEKDIEVDIDISPISPQGEWKFDKHTNVQNADYLINNTDDYWDLKCDQALCEIINMWLEYKDQKKPRSTHHYVEKGLRGLLKKFVSAHNEFGLKELTRVVEDSISNNYSGITWDKMKKQSKHDSTESYVNEWLEAAKEVL